MSSTDLPLRDWPNQLSNAPSPSIVVQQPFVIPRVSLGMDQYEQRSQSLQTLVNQALEQSNAALNQELTAFPADLIKQVRTGKGSGRRGKRHLPDGAEIDRWSLQAWQEATIDQRRAMLKEINGFLSKSKEKEAAQDAPKKKKVIDETDSDSDVPIQKRQKIRSAPASRQLSPINEQPVEIEPRIQRQIEQLVNPQAIPIPRPIVAPIQAAQPSQPSSSDTDDESQEEGVKKTRNRHTKSHQEWLDSQVTVDSQNPFKAGSGPHSLWQRYFFLVYQLS